MIKKLRAVNQLNRDRIFSKQSLRKIRNREEDNLFSLSPDKADEWLFSDLAATDIFYRINESIR